MTGFTETEALLAMSTTYDNLPREAQLLWLGADLQLAQALADEAQVQVTIEELESTALLLRLGRELGRREKQP